MSPAERTKKAKKRKRVDPERGAVEEDPPSVVEDTSENGLEGKKPKRKKKREKERERDDVVADDTSKTEEQGSSQSIAATRIHKHTYTHTTHTASRPPSPPPPPPPPLHRYPGAASGRRFTVSMALPGSIVDNAQTLELKTYLAGQVPTSTHYVTSRDNLSLLLLKVARAAAIFSVDEIIIFNEQG